MNPDLIQYPAVTVSLVGAFLNAQRSTNAKRWGFVLWLISNLLLIIYSALISAWGLTAMYLIFFGTSAIGLWNHRRPGDV